MATLSECVEDLKGQSDEDVADTLEMAKAMKANYQTLIEACYRVQETRRIAAPSVRDEVILKTMKHHAEQEQVGHAVQFVGVLEGSPVFEFKAENPPAWMINAIEDGTISVSGESAFLRGKPLTSGDVVTRSEVLS